MRLSRSVSVRVLAVAVALGTAGSLTACGGGGGNPGSGNASLVKLTTTSIPNGTTGVAYSAQFAALFPHTPGIFVVTAGAIPLGLKLDKSTGILSGYPRQVGAFQFEIAARDGIDLSIPQQRDASFAEDRRTFSVTIALGDPNILPQQPPSAQYRASYSYQIDVAGGTLPYTFAQIGGVLPAGVTVSASGLLSSFPTQATQHPYTFVVKVTDALGKIDTETLTLDVVVLPLIIQTGSPIQSGAQNFAYDVPLDLASLGAGQPITWSQAWRDASNQPTPYPPGTPLVPNPGVTLPPGDVLVSTIGMEIANVSGQGRFRNAIPSPGPTTLGTFQFTAAVTDEAGQLATRQYSFTVNAGPVLTGITPNRSTSGAPITLTGLNFQAGAVAIFKPGVTQVQVTPNSQTTTSLTLLSVPASPGGGFVTVRVKNPDGGFFDLPNAYAFPAANITFNSSAVFPNPNSSLSSTGVDAADLNGDGFADFVHCGSNSTWRNASGNAGGVDLMLNTPPGGVFSVGTPTFTRVQLAIGNDWYDVKLSDVNSDGRLDVVAVGNVGSRVVRVWRSPALNATAGQWAAVVPDTTTLLSQTSTLTNFGFQPHVAGLAVGKITTDGLPDLAYTQQDYPGFISSPSGNASGRVSTMKGVGNGTFSGLETGFQLQNQPTGSLNGVGILPAGTRGNVFVSDAAGGLMAWNWGAGGNYGNYTRVGSYIATNTSDLFGGWTNVDRTGSYSSEFLCVATGDVNGDGIIDAVVPTGPTIIAGGAVQAVWAFINNGSTFTTTQATAGSAGAERYATVFDIDFDGFLDCAVTVATNRVDFFKGRTGTQGLQFKSSIQVVTNAPNVSKLAWGDFDKDGKNDVVVCTSFLADNAVVTNYGQGAAAVNDRGIGGQQGVFILLNTSQ